MDICELHSQKHILTTHNTQYMLTLYVIAPVNRHLPQLYAHVSLLEAMEFIQYNNLSDV